MAVIAGTAGHIDHGKTSLVRALTNIDCDRLVEEKQRGITIDLGFAWLDLPQGERLGIIDVPGHERFVRTMVAGACGIDLVVLVIAADEGIMPQTREHLEICSLLGVKYGLVALTKVDLVEPDWLALVTEEVTSYLRGSVLEGAPVCPVSSTTMQGIPAFTDALIRLASKVKSRQSSDIFRLPIDRAFSLHGRGTIVTGTVLSGSIGVGENVVCMPGHTPSRVRSLERHGKALQRIEKGSRCAINLQGLEKSDVRRGQTVCAPNTLFPSKRWFLKVKALPSSPFALKQRGEVHFHHGTREALARLIFREKTSLQPGEEAFAEALFQEEFCGVFGDRCVVRASSPLRTVAGAEVLCPLPPLWPGKKVAREGLATRWLALPVLREQAQKDTAFLSELLDLTGLPGKTLAEMRVLSGLDDTVLDKALSLLLSKAQAVLWDKEERSFLGRRHFDTLLEQCLNRAEELHAKDPLRATFARDALLGSWSRDLPGKLVQKVLDVLIANGKLCQESDGLRLASHSVSLAGDEAELADKILAAVQKGLLSPPGIKDVLRDLTVSEKEAAPVLALLCKRGELVRVKDGLYYEKNVLNEFLSRVRTWFETNDNLDVAALKAMFGLSRKFLISLLEYMDNAHITVRVGDCRRLRRTN